jgi:hypothetical protein
VGLKFGSYSQQQVINSFIGLRLCAKLLSALAASSGNIRLRHVNVVELKISFVGDHPRRSFRYWHFGT